MRNNSFITVAGKNLFKTLVVSFICFIGGGMIASASSSPTLRAVVQIVFFAAASLLCYNSVWELGQADENLVKIGAKKNSYFKGLFCGLIGSAPMILSGILLIAEKAEIISLGVLPYFRILSGVYYPLNYSILPIDRTMSLLSWQNIMLAVAVHLILPIICTFAYLLGRNSVKLTDRLLYKKPN